MWTVHELKKMAKAKRCFFQSTFSHNLLSWRCYVCLSVCQLLLTCLRRFVAISQSYHQKKRDTGDSLRRPTFLRVIIWDSHESQNFNGSGFFHASCRNKQLWICFGSHLFQQLKGLFINCVRFRDFFFSHCLQLKNWKF